MFYQTNNTESYVIIQERLSLEIDDSLNQLNSKNHYQQNPREIIMSNQNTISVFNRTFLTSPKSTHQIITRSNKDTTPAALQIPKRIPQALKCLADFKNPGLNEQ